MQLFFFSTHVNPSSCEFLGDCWEDGGVRCDDEGSPKCDVGGNSIARSESRPIEFTDTAAIRLAYCGDETIDDWQHFKSYLLTECELSEADTNKVLIAFDAPVDSLWCRWNSDAVKEFVAKSPPPNRGPEFWRNHNKEIATLDREDHFAEITEDGFEHDLESEAE